MFKQNMLFYNFTEQYHLYNCPADYAENYHQTIAADDPKSKYFLEIKEHIDSEMAKFNGKVSFDKNEGETASTMSGMTKKSKITEKANQLAANAKEKYGDGAAKRGEKTIKFDDGYHSPDDSPSMRHPKDIAADDPKRRTYEIDKVLGGDVEGVQFSGNTASLDDLAKMNSRQLRQIQQEEEE